MDGFLTSPKYVSEDKHRNAGNQTYHQVFLATMLLTALVTCATAFDAESTAFAMEFWRRGRLTRCQQEITYIQTNTYLGKTWAAGLVASLAGVGALRLVNGVIMLGF